MTILSLSMTLALISCTGRDLALMATDKICKPVIISTYDLTMTEADVKVLNSAKAGCKRYYGPQSCLKRFIKVKERQYHAICNSNWFY